jgi:hypothetical protein
MTSILPGRIPKNLERHHDHDNRERRDAEKVMGSHKRTPTMLTGMPQRRQKLASAGFF